MRTIGLVSTLIAGSMVGAATAGTVTVSDTDGQPLATAMVTRVVIGGDSVDTADNGYPRPGRVNTVVPQETRFSDTDGRAIFEALAADGMRQFRVRKQGYADAVVTSNDHEPVLSVALERLSDPESLAQSKPANLWLSGLRFDYARDPQRTREHFLRHCSFCHQQASVFMRQLRTREQWADIIERMQLYGAMASEDFVSTAADGLAQAFADLNRRYQELPPFEAWAPSLADANISEWPIGDAFSQMHDFLVHPNGKVYVGDNLMDRIYVIDPAGDSYEVFKVPHDADAKPGGVLGDRLASYPKVDNYMGVHSFALAPRDGHIFLTPSMRQELVEFDPDSGEFRRYAMDEGFYPHTIRVDDQDRVWFTLALSSQVAMFDRRTATFTTYDLPARGPREWLALKIIKLRLSRGWVGSRPDLDWETTGFPMPYGIDVSPADGSVWVARLYADDIARIDPGTGKVSLIKTPFAAPRRLRFDARGDLWIVAFSEGRIARYDPVGDRFSLFDLPVVGETPYALNVDRDRGVVWVTGNQSDTILSFHIASKTWRVFPMPRRRTFTRDIGIAADGSVYTSNSHFPGWMIEGGQPTLIHVDPGLPADPVIVRGAQLYARQCDNCHAQPEINAPRLSTLSQMPFTRVSRALEFGVMAQQAARLSPDERLAIARYLGAGNSRSRDQWIDSNRCPDRGLLDVNVGVEDNWGFGPGNRRALESGVDISVANAGRLELLWSLAIPDATEMQSQPVAADGILFLGTANGNVLAIDQASGCIHWRFAADGPIRSALSLETTSDGIATLFFADDPGTVYAITADDGRLRWKRSLQWFPATVINGSLAYFEDHLFVPISSFESSLAGLDSYPCCRSHGGVVSIDTTDGTIAWEYHTTPTALQVGSTSASTDIWGPSGATVETTPAIDARRGLLYIGTGPNTSHPATYNSDAVIALDTGTGAVDWVYQASAADIWNIACQTGGANCPQNAGQGFGFGGGITLATDSSGRDIVIAGQRSGVVHALDPDTRGRLLWQQRLGAGTANGGIHWGVAASGDTVWVPVADPPGVGGSATPGSGVYALDLSNGAVRWSLPVTRGCEVDPADVPGRGVSDNSNHRAGAWPTCPYYFGMSAAPLYANGLLYAGGLDGKLRILDATLGETLTVIATSRSYRTVNGVDGHGGAIDLGGVVADGRRLFVYSGYGMFGQMPGNVLLAFELPR